MARKFARRKRLEVGPPNSADAASMPGQPAGANNRVASDPAAELLRASQARLAGILDIADDAIITVDRQQRITLFNQGAEKIFGYTAQEVLGQPLDLLLPGRFIAVHHQHLDTFASSTETARRDVQLPDIDGYEIRRRLKADPELRVLPIVAVTALAMVGDRDQILAAGFDGYLSKPIVPETFVAQVEAFLAPAHHVTLVPPAAPFVAPEPSSSPMRTRATILVVDDSPLNHELMRSLLEPFGYDVVTAGGVREALVLARERQPELIVSDLHMPNQNGFDLIRAINADPLLRQIKIIIHSATIMSDQDRRDALGLGAMKFLARPLEPQIILAEIESCLHEQPEQHHGNDTRT